MSAIPTWVASNPVPVLVRPPKPERQITATPELAQLRSALDAIPNDSDPLDYDQWRNVIFAIHHATDGSSDGLAIAHEFSARSGKYDAEFLEERVWPYVGVNSSDPITERTIFALAGQHGWIDPAVMDEFDVVEADDADEFEALPDEKEPGKKPRFQVLDEDEFLDAPPMSWLIKNVVPKAELGVIYGESASGKSFMALDIGAAVARGMPWRDHKVTQGRVVYIAAEGAGGFRKRMTAYRMHNELERTGVQIIADAPNLIEKADAVDICKSILAGGKADLVIIDTLAQSMQGNENSGEDMGRVLAHCKGIHRATGAMVVLVHHSGKDSAKGARGWSGLRAACDVELEVVRADDDRVLTVTKQKDGGDTAEFGFKLEVVPIGMDDDGDVISSCVVAHGAVARGVKRGPQSKTEQLVYRTMMDLISPGGDWPTRDEVVEECLARTTVPEGKRDTRPRQYRQAIDSLMTRGAAIAEGLRMGPPD